MWLCWLSRPWINDRAQVSHHDYRHAINKPPVDLGINLVQSSVVDFSGASGIPVLIATSYRFTGAPNRTKGVMLSGMNGGLTLTGSAFQIGRGATPSARGVLVTERPPETVESHVGGDSGNFSFVYGPETYLYVLAPGATTDPQVTGSGANVQVTLGGQTISIQNDALVLKVPPK